MNVYKSFEHYQHDIQNETLTCLDRFSEAMKHQFPTIELMLFGVTKNSILHLYNNSDQVNQLFHKYNGDLLHNLKAPKGCIPISSNNDALFSIPNTTSNCINKEQLLSHFKGLEPDVLVLFDSLLSPKKGYILVPLMDQSKQHGFIIIQLKSMVSSKILEPILLLLPSMLPTINLYYLSRFSSDTDIHESVLNNSLSVFDSANLTGYIHGSFLSAFLKLAMTIIPEVDYGSASEINNGLWLFDSVIGHDAEALKKIPITKDVYAKNMLLAENGTEIVKDVHIIHNIVHKKPDTSKASNIYKQIEKASQPIKTTMQVHITKNNALKAIISLDISTKSPLYFTKQSAQLLQYIGNIARMVYTYNDIYQYTDSFANMTEFIASIINRQDVPAKEFIHDFLKMLLTCIPEADYGSIYLITNGQVRFLDAFGHDINKLRQLDIHEDYFNLTNIIPDNADEFVPLTIHKNIMANSLKKMPLEIREDFQAAIKPMKETVICHYIINQNLKLNVALDIDTTSYVNFTTDSIRMIRAFSNIGFTYIAKQLFANESNPILSHQLKHLQKKQYQENSDHNIPLRFKDAVTDTHLLSHFLVELSNYQEKENDLSLIYIDIDDFKKINQIHGFEQGDDILKSIAYIINRVPIKKIIGRYNSNGFLILLANANLADAAILGGQLCRQVRSTTFDKDINITICSVVLNCINKAPHDILEKACAMMASQKKQGGNSQLTEESYDH